MLIIRLSFCHESGCHSLHILHHTTAAHHLWTASPIIHCLTHSHPPLHQSHSCHQSLISLDCLTTPAPHSHTHTFKQHSYMHSPRSLVLALADISERYLSCYLLSLCLTPDCPTLELWTRACDPDFCLVCLRLCPASDIPVFARWPLPFDSVY